MKDLAATSAGRQRTETFGAGEGRDLAGWTGRIGTDRHYQPAEPAESEAESASSSCSFPRIIQRTLCQTPRSNFPETLIEDIAHEQVFRFLHAGEAYQPAATCATVGG